MGICIDCNIANFATIIMGTNHGTTRPNIGVITDSNTCYNLIWLLWKTTQAQKTTKTSLVKGKELILLTNGVFYIRIFTNSYRTRLVIIAVSSGIFTNSYITIHISIMRTTSIVSMGVFTDGYHPITLGIRTSTIRDTSTSTNSGISRPSGCRTCRNYSA